MRARWPRRILVALGIVLLLPLAAVLTAYALVQTPWGAERARRALVPRLDAALPGQLEIGGLRLAGDVIVLSGVRLRTAEGEPVLALPAVLLDVQPLALVSGRIGFDRIVLVSPVIDLDGGPEGLDLVRALSKETRAREPEGRPPAATIGRLVVQDATLRFDAPEAPSVRLTGLGILGSLELRPDPFVLDAGLSVQGRLEAPVPEALRWTASVDVREAVGSAGTELRVGESRLAVDLRLSGPETQAGRVEAHVTPQHLAAAAPLDPPRAPLALDASFARQGAETRVDLQAHAGAARLEAEGAVDAGRRAATGLSLSGRAIDLSAFLPGAARTHLAFELRADGRFPSLAEADGHLRFELQPSQGGGHEVGPLRVMARAEGGRVRAELAGRLPGLALDGDVISDPDGALDGRVAVEVTDLRRLAAVLAAATGQPLPEVIGRGTVVLRPLGDVARPGLEIRLAVPRAAWGDHAVVDLEGTLHVPDLSEPWFGRHRLAIRRILGVGPHLDGVSLRAESTREALSVRAAIERGWPMSVSVDGAWRTPGRSVRLRDGALRYPETRWRLDGPADLSWGHGVSVTGLGLAADGQRLRADVQGGDGVRATVRLAPLHLTSLPAFALPPGLRPSGRVEGRLDLRSPPDGPPTGEWDLRLVEGGVAGLEGIAAHLEGRLEAGRVRAQVRSRMRGGRLYLDLDVPRDANAADAPPIYAAMLARALPLGGLLEATRAVTREPLLPAVASASGILDAEGRLTGRLPAPGVQGRLELRDGRVELAAGQVLEDVWVRAAGDETRLEQLEATTRSEGGRLRLGGEAERREDGAWDLRLRAEAEDFPLPGEADQRVSGLSRTTGRAGPDGARFRMIFDDVVLSSPAVQTARRIR